MSGESATQVHMIRILMNTVQERENTNIIVLTFESDAFPIKILQETVVADSLL